MSIDYVLFLVPARHDKAVSCLSSVADAPSRSCVHEDERRAEQRRDHPGVIKKTCAECDGSGAERFRRASWIDITWIFLPSVPTGATDILTGHRPPVKSIILLPRGELRRRGEGEPNKSSHRTRTELLTRLEFARNILSTVRITYSSARLQFYSLALSINNKKR